MSVRLVYTAERDGVVRAVDGDGITRAFATRRVGGGWVVMTALTPSTRRYQRHRRDALRALRRIATLRPVVGSSATERGEGRR
jgi:hypothetical protein